MFVFLWFSLSDDSFFLKSHLSLSGESFSSVTILLLRRPGRLELFHVGPPCPRCLGFTLRKMLILYLA